MAREDGLSAGDRDDDVQLLDEVFNTRVEGDGVHLDTWVDPDTGSAVLAFDPDQPRDSEGRWVDETGEGTHRHIFYTIVKEHFGDNYESYPSDSGDVIVHEFDEGRRFVALSLKDDIVSVDFGIHGKEGTFSAKQLQSGSLDLLRRLKKVAKDVHDAGLKLSITPSDERRKGVYERMLTSVGLTKISEESAGYKDPTVVTQIWLSSNTHDDAPMSHFDPSQPRKPEGTPEGGQFARRGEGGGGVNVVKYGPYKVKYVHRTAKRISGPKIRLKNYVQHDQHSCGFVSALTLAHFFETGATPRDVLAAVKPTKASGINRKELTKALSELGVKAEYVGDLTIGKLRKNVQSSVPTLVTVWPDDWASDHWTTVHGFNKDMDKIYLTNYRNPPVSEFKREWFSYGEGLLCRKKPSTATSLPAPTPPGGGPQDGP